MRTRSLLFLLLLLGSVARADEIDDLVRANMDADGINGVALGIVVDGVLQESRSYGLANIETGTAVWPETVFKIASLSKAFCAAVTMMLIEEGKLSLEDRVVYHLPTAPESWGKIRIKHLLSHTSGIPRAPGFQFSAQYTPEEFVALFDGIELAEEPGEKYRYNNFGFATLGQIVHKVTGMLLREYVTERILEPLGMTATHYYEMGRIVPHRANGYRRRDGSYSNPNPARPRAYDGSGGVLTSVLDYALWDKALRSDDLLSAEIKEKMWTRFTLNDGSLGEYGFGWFPDEVDGERVVWHHGNTQGFTAHVIRGLESGVTVFVFRNGSGSEAQSLARGILAAYKEQSGRKADEPRSVHSVRHSLSLSWAQCLTLDRRSLKRMNSMPRQ
ncbi:MAG: beta-lactamase family protein [Armatimonadetes bacterium]|nr:beta-lactamase family protein [Armatimonadota bacterium]